MLAVNRWWTDPSLTGWSVRTTHELLFPLGAATRAALMASIREVAGEAAPVILAWDGELLVWLALRAPSARAAALTACRIVETAHDRLGLDAPILGARVAAAPTLLRRPGPDLPSAGPETETGGSQDAG